MNEVDRLINEAMVNEAKARVASDSAPTDPRAEKVRDVAHMKEIISDVLKRAIPPEAQRWLDAGHRAVALSEAPMVIDGVVGRDVTVPQFRWGVRRWINKDWEGTAIYAHSRKQYSGRWEVAGFKIIDGSEGRYDTKVAANPRQIDGFKEGEIELLEGANSDTFATVRVGTIQVVIVWVDSANEAEIKYDKDGKEKEGPTVVVQNGGGNNTAEVVAAVLRELGHQKPGTAPEASTETPQEKLHWKQREKLERDAAAAKAAGGS